MNMQRILRTPQGGKGKKSIVVPNKKMITIKSIFIIKGQRDGW